MLLARAELRIRHADLRREATAVITKSSSPLLHDTAVWYEVPGMGVWACGCLFGGGTIDAMDEKNTCKTFSTEFFGWIRQSENSFEKG